MCQELDHFFFFFIRACIRVYNMYTVYIVNTRNASKWLEFVEAVTCLFEHMVVRTLNHLVLRTKRQRDLGATHLAI